MQHIFSLGNGGHDQQPVHFAGEHLLPLEVRTVVHFEFHFHPSDNGNYRGVSLVVVLYDLVELQRSHRTVCSQLPKVLVNGVLDLDLLVRQQLAEVFCLAVQADELACGE